MTTSTTDVVDTWEMVLAHKLYRREFRILPGIIRAVRPGDTERAALVGRHLTLITDQLHHHHEAEDELLWPLMLQRVGPDAEVVRRMEAQHTRLAGLLDQVGPLSEGWRRGADEQARDTLAELLTQISAAVDEHLDDEERDLLPLVPGNITVAEWTAMNRRLQDAGKALGPKLAMVLLGYMLEDATDQEKALFSAEMPPPIRLAWRLFGSRTYAKARDQVRLG